MKNTLYRDIAELALEAHRILEGIHITLDSKKEPELHRCAMQAAQSTRQLIAEAKALDKGRGV